jgi:hypothetical protein
VPEPAEHGEEAIYEVKIRGILDESWSDWLDGLSMTPTGDGNTVLAGLIRDQCALHGLLVKIRDLGLPLLSVEQREQTGG